MLQTGGATIKLQTVAGVQVRGMVLKMPPIGLGRYDGSPLPTVVGLNGAKRVKMMAWELHRRVVAEMTHGETMVEEVGRTQETAGETIRQWSIPGTVLIGNPQ